MFDDHFEGIRCVSGSPLAPILNPTWQAKTHIQFVNACLFIKNCKKMSLL